MKSYRQRIERKSMRRGWAEGWAKGWAEGERNGRLQIFFAILKGRFGTLPRTVAAKVRAAAPEQLNEWAVELLDAERSEKLYRHWAGSDRSSVR